MIKAIGKLSNSLSRYDIVINGIDSLDKGLDAKSGAANFLLKYLRSEIIDCLLRSYASSGIKTKKGRLIAAIKSSSIDIVNGRIRISFSSQSSEKVLAQGASLNYGSVRNSQGLGAKAKRTLKNATLSGVALSKRQQARLTKGYKGRFSNPNTGFTEMKHWKPVDVSKISVRPPKRFYYISASDTKRLQEKFSSLFNKWLKHRFGNKK